MEKSESTASQAIGRNVRKAQVQLLYHQTRIALAGSVIVSLAACLALWPVVSHWKLTIWTGVSVLITIGRCLSVVAFERSEPVTSVVNYWGRIHYCGVVLSGMLWAAPSFFMWPAENSVYQLFWPILILPLSAAAVSTYYTWTVSYVTFVVLAVLPLSIRFFLQGGYLFNILGILALFFIAVLLRAGRVMNTASVNSFEFGIRNEALNKNLREEITAREQLNLQFQHEIADRILSEHKLSQRNYDLLKLNVELTTTKSNLEAANRKLEEAMANIRQLSGMLPICASCKKIRNDRGYWEILETYFKEHSDVVFSHGLCPDCAKALYPEIYKRKKKKQEPQNV